MHSYLLRNGLLDASPPASTSLINMYSKCSLMNKSLHVFNTTTHDLNVYTFNAVISGFVSNGNAKQGLNLYRQMRIKGVLPDKYTFPCLLKGCCDAMEVLEVRKIHGMVFKLGFDLDLYVGSALVKCYLNFLFMENAEKVFNELSESDSVLWNAMVNGYAQLGRFADALGVFERMWKEGVLVTRFTVTGVLSVFALIGDVSNGRAIHAFLVKMGYDSAVAVSNALIDMYGKCNFISDAIKTFETMHENDIYSWNSIMFLHEHCGDHEKTLQLFYRMLGSGFQPDLVTVTTVLPACTQLAALMHGKQIHSYMIINGMGKDENFGDIDDVLTSNAIMDMYAKCGSMRDAQLVFNKVGNNKDVVSWNIMIMGYGMHGYGIEALDVFSRICESGFKPDHVTFIGVLSACSHAGMVSQGRGFLNQMKSKYGITPSIEHYTCVIDMLGRSGQLDEAYELAQTLPTEANPVVWRALLAACQLHGDRDLAEVVAKQVLELEPEDCGSYVLMSNVYVTAGRFEQVLDIRSTMREQKVRKSPGCSWIELKDGVHGFLNSDRTHPAANAIYARLKSLTALLFDHAHHVVL